MNIENIENHLAKYCECGSVHFNLLKSNSIECSKCGKVFGKWNENLSNNIEQLKILSEKDFSLACEFAENNIDCLKEFFETWSKNCGAQKYVFVGHTVKMLIELDV